MKLKKLFVFGAVCASSIMLLTFNALADSTTVSNKSNGITVTKKANWTEYEGKSTDSDGNPYIKIDFNIDATNYYVPKVIPKPTDIVLCMDVSDSIISKNALENEKKLAINFINSLNLTQNTNTRVEIVLAADNSDNGLTIVKFTNDKSQLINTISQMKPNILYSATDSFCSKTRRDNEKIYSEEGYESTWYNKYNAFEGTKNSTIINQTIAACYQRLKFYSKAEKTAIVFISDGETSIPVENVLTQVRAGEGQVNNLTYYTIGYIKNRPALELLEKIATDNLDNKKRCFNAYKTSEDTIISSILNDLGFTINSKASLVDLIPKECSIIKESLTSVADITSTIDNNVINWKWDTNKFNSKVYSFSVITKLDMQQAKNKSQIFTNGQTIDTTSQTPGSCTFKYGTISIELNSPMLQLANQNTDNTVNTDNTDNTVIEKTPNDENIQKDIDLDNVPKTADNYQLYISILGVIIASIVIISIIVYKRKKSHINIL